MDLIKSQKQFFYLILSRPASVKHFNLLLKLWDISKFGSHNFLRPEGSLLSESFFFVILTTKFPYLLHVCPKTAVLGGRLIPSLSLIGGWKKEAELDQMPRMELCIIRCRQFEASIENTQKSQTTTALLGPRLSGTRLGRGEREKTQLIQSSK